MRDNPLYHRLRQQMRAGTNEDLVADLKRFVESFGDHDPDCPVSDNLRDELDTCTCGYARRFDFYDELLRRLSSE
jgi:hypothetical protein